MGQVDIESIRRMASEQAAAAEAAGRLTPSLVEAMRAAGLFKLYLPATMGGLDLSLGEACSVIARLAEADGAAGWAAMINAGPNWFAGHMDPDLASEVFGAPDSIVAGSGAPGSAEQVPGGFTVSGRWRYCSGAPWATWFTFTATTTDGQSVAFAVPRDDVRLHSDTWNVRGLRATASWDAELDAVLVPTTRTFRLDEPDATPTLVISRVPFPCFAHATMAAVSIGLMRHCLHEYRALAETKQPMLATTTLAESPVARDRIARATASARAAELYLAHATAAVSDAAELDEVPDADLMTDLQLAACHAVATGGQVGTVVWELAGMSVLPVDSDLGRVIADLHAATQNALVAGARFADVDPPDAVD